MAAIFIVHQTPLCKSLSSCHTTNQNKIESGIEVPRYLAWIPVHRIFSEKMIYEGYLRNNHIIEKEFDQEGVHFNQDYCTICLEVFREGGSIVEIVRCHHIFHIGCLRNWVDRSGSRKSHQCVLCNYCIREEDEVVNNQELEDNLEIGENQQGLGIELQNEVEDLEENLNEFPDNINEGRIVEEQDEENENEEENDLDFTDAGLMMDDLDLENEEN